MGFEQAGGTMSLFADKQTDRTLAFGWEVPASYFQAINPLAIVALGPHAVDDVDAASTRRASRFRRRRRWGSA